MANRHLRVYYGPEAESDELSGHSRQSLQSDYARRVTVPLKDILSTLTEAMQRRRGWVQDFEEDEVTISTDLYEVILAYQHYHRPSA